MGNVSVDIRIFGACLATPSRGGKVPRLSILTPCSPRSRKSSDGVAQIDAMYTYLVVDPANLDATASTRLPDLVDPGKKAQAFMFHREEITIAGEAADGVELASEGTSLPQTPSNGARDVRWIPHLPTLLQGATVKQDCVTNPDPPAELCTRFVFHSGAFTGQFPCGNAKKRKIKNTSVSAFLAQEMIVSVGAADGTLTLRCTPFAGAKGEASDIVLKAQNGKPFHVFFVTGPLINVIELLDFDPCKTSNDHRAHVDADYEFETLWDLFDVPPGAKLPIPEIPASSPGPRGPRADCVPGGGS